MKRGLGLAVAALYLLHNDVWLWGDRSLIAGLPVGLLYHLAYCAAAALLMAALVRWAWPRDLDATPEAPAAPGPDAPHDAPGPRGREGAALASLDGGRGREGGSGGEGEGGDLS